VAPALYLMHPSPPYNTSMLLNSFFGRQFNSLNDVSINPRTGDIYFTDPTYGYVQEFRPSPGLQKQVYRFNESTGAVTVVADGFNMPNGESFFFFAGKRMVTFDLLKLTKRAETCASRHRLLPQRPARLHHRHGHEPGLLRVRLYVAVHHVSHFSPPSLPMHLSELINLLEMKWTDGAGSDTDTMSRRTGP